MPKHALETVLIPCLNDNYAVLVHDPESKSTLLVDAPIATPVLHILEDNNWKLTHILLTHHHHDHIGGLAALQGVTGATIYGPEESMSRVQTIETGVNDGDKIKFGDLDIMVIATPGHTRDHLSFWIPDAELAFTGDTLFAMGCGRVFEGTMEDMWSSLDRLAKLPPETTIYCGHEYTLSNGEFCLTIEPDNELLQQRMETVRAQRERGEPTIPTTLLDELTTNSFLRANNAEVKEALGMADASDLEVFTEIRSRKDNF